MAVTPFIKEDLSLLPFGTEEAYSLCQKIHFFLDRNYNYNSFIPQIVIEHLKSVSHCFMYWHFSGKQYMKAHYSPGA